MNAGVVNALQPGGELGIEFFEGGGALARQAQAGFKVLLNGEANPLDLPLGPTVKGLGVQ
jgi:hypothetical protein